MLNGGKMFRLVTLVCFVSSLLFATPAFTTTNNNFEIAQIISISKNVANMMRREGGKEEANRLMARVIPVERNFKQGIMYPQKQMEIALLHLRTEILYRNAMLNLGWGYYAPAKNNKREIDLLQFVNRLQYQLHNIEKRINKVLGDRK